MHGKKATTNKTTTTGDSGGLFQAWRLYGTQVRATLPQAIPWKLLETLWRTGLRLQRLSGSFHVGRRKWYLLRYADLYELLYKHPAPKPKPGNATWNSHLVTEIKARTFWVPMASAALFPRFQARARAGPGLRVQLQLRGRGEDHEVGEAAEDHHRVLGPNLMESPLRNC